MLATSTVGHSVRSREPRLHVEFDSVIRRGCDNEEYWEYQEHGRYGGGYSELLEAEDASDSEV